MISPRYLALASLALLVSGARAQSEWKTLIWVSTRATVVSDANGIRRDRYFINDPELDRIREALDAFQKAAKAESGLEVTVDMKIDNAPIYRFPGQGEDPLLSTVATRFNEATFESDDKTYRGPYSGVIVVDAQPGAAVGRRVTMGFGTPIGYASMLPTNGGTGVSALAQDFMAVFRAEAAMRSGVEKITDWSRVPAPGAVVRSKISSLAPIDVFKPLDPVGPGQFGAITKSETENGPAIKVLVNSGPREGQVLLADGLSVDLASTPVLEFWMRITALDPLELRFGDRSLAIGWYAGAKNWIEPERGGKWQKFSVGLGGSGAVNSASLAVPEAARALENLQFGTREIEIAGLRFLKGEVTEQGLPSDEALRVSLASATPAEAEAALANPSNAVKIAALYRLAYGDSPPPDSVFKRLVELSKHPDPAVSILAIRAMTRVQSPELAAALKYNLEVGPFEHCRLGAAWALAGIGNETNTPLLATMLTAREWPSRLAGVQGLAKFPSRENTIILLAMLQDPEAVTRRAICSLIHLNMDLANRRLLFVAVNDPVEAVRVAAYRNLLTNGLEEYKGEAMKGVREESPFVRSEILKVMSDKPDVAFRRTILIGLGDKDPRVRLAAIEALWQQTGDIRREEIAGVLQDPDEEVRQAAKALAQARGIH